MKEKIGAMASSTPMTNQLALILMILPFIISKSPVNIKVTHRGGSNGVGGSHSPFGAQGGDKGNNQRETPMH